MTRKGVTDRGFFITEKVKARDDITFEHHFFAIHGPPGHDITSIRKEHRLR